MGQLLHLQNGKMSHTFRPCKKGMVFLKLKSKESLFDHLWIILILIFLFCNKVLDNFGRLLQLACCCIQLLDEVSRHLQRLQPEGEIPCVCGLQRGQWAGRQVTSDNKTQFYQLLVSCIGWLVKALKSKVWQLSIAVFQEPPAVQELNTISFEGSIGKWHLP